MSSVFSFRLRDLAGGEALVGTEMVPPIHTHALKRSTVVCVGRGRVRLKGPTALTVPLCLLGGAQASSPVLAPGGLATFYCPVLSRQ